MIRVIWPIWGGLLPTFMGCLRPQQAGTASTEADALNGTTTLFSDRTCGIKAGVTTTRGQKRVLKFGWFLKSLFNHQTKGIEPVNLGSSQTKMVD